MTASTVRNASLAALAALLLVATPIAHALEIGGCKLDLFNPKGSWECVQKAFDKLRSAADKTLAAAGKVVGKVVEGVLPKGLLEAYGRLKDTMACLHQQGGKGGFDPGKLMGDLLQNAGPALQSLFQKAWPLVLSGLNKLVTGSGSVEPTLPKLLSVLWTQVEGIAAEVGPLACVMKLVRPLYKKAEPILAKVVGDVEAGILKAVRENVGPMVSKIAAASIEWIVSQLGGENGVKRLREIVGSVLMAADKLAGAGKKLGELAAAIKQRTGLDKALALAKDLGAPADKFTLSAMVDVVKVLIEDKAKEFVQEKGGEIIDVVLKSFSSVYNVLNRLIGSLCGLIPEAGGVICELTLSAGLRTSWDWLLSVQVKKLAIAEAQRWVDQAVDFLARIVRERFAKKIDDQTAGLRQKLGGVARAVDGVATKVIKFLEDYVQPAFAQMQEYHNKVKELADAALDAAARSAAGK